MSWRPMYIPTCTWAQMGDFYRRNIAEPTPELVALLGLCEHVDRAPYKDLIFCAQSHFTLMVSQHREMEWYCGVLCMDPGSAGQISLALHEQPFVAPATFQCAPEALIAAFENFLQKNKWVSDDAFRSSHPA